MAEYIEREAAEKILYDGCHTMNGNEGPDDVVEMWHMVQAIPSADVQPDRHGRWIEYPECLRFENAYSDDHIVCSECHKVFSVLDNCTETFNYCPNCGAKMDKEGE